MNYLGVLIP